jgi:hypothetical protein
MTALSFIYIVMVGEWRALALGATRLSAADGIEIRLSDTERLTRREREVFLLLL